MSVRKSPQSISIEGFFYVFVPFNLSFEPLSLVSILHRLKQEYEHNYGEINKSGYKAFTIYIMLHT